MVKLTLRRRGREVHLVERPSPVPTSFQVRKVRVLEKCSVIRGVLLVSISLKGQSESWKAILHLHTWFATL